MKRPSLKRSQVLTGTLLVCILGTAVSLRVQKLTSESIHFDEAWNLELSTGRGSVQERLATNVVLPQVPRVTSLAGAPGIGAIWTHMDHVTHPPLYSMVLRLWREVFGESDLAAKSLSVVLSCLCVLLLFDLVRLVTGTTAGLWSATLMALAGSQVELAQEIRPYMLAVLLMLCAGDILVRFQKHGPSKLKSALLVTCTLAMALTHYFTIPFALALFGYAMLRQQKVVIPFVIAGVLFAVLWGPQLWEQRGNFGATGDNWLKESSDGHLLKTGQRLAALPMRLLFEPTARTTLISYGAAIVLVLPLLMLRFRKDLLFWCAWLLGTVGLLLALDLTRSTWHLGLVRYTLFASPAIFALLASLTSRIPNKVIHYAIPLVASLGCLAAIPTFYYHGKPDFRSLASYIDQRIQPGEIVVFTRAGAEPFYHRVLFLGTSHYAKSYPWPVVLLDGGADVDLTRELQSAPSVWMIGAANRPADTSIPGMVETESWQMGYTARVSRMTLAGK